MLGPPAESFTICLRGAPSMGDIMDRLYSFFDRVSRPADVPFDEQFSPWRLKLLTPTEFARLSPALDRLSDEQLAYFAWFNLLAPTSHNTVPQRFRFHPDENALTVWVDRKFVLSASDPTGRQALVSIGCGIENSVVAARHLGWQSEITVAPVESNQVRPAIDSEPRYSRVARIEFRRAPERADSITSDIEAMLRRKIVRAEYDDSVKLDPDVVRRVHAIVSEHPGLEAHLITDAASLLFLGKFQEIADTTVFNRETFALELGEWLLANDSESPVGMRGAEFGLSDDVSRHIHAGLLRLEKLLPDEMAAFAKAGNIGMRTASAVVVITVEDDSIPLRIAAGRAYEAVVLMLLQRGFCTAMHAGITEVEAPNLALRGRLRTRSRPTVVFRVGKPLHERDWLRPHSSRPSLAVVMLPDSVAG